MVCFIACFTVEPRFPEWCTPRPFFTTTPTQTTEERLSKTTLVSLKVLLFQSFVFIVPCRVFCQSVIHCICTSYAIQPYLPWKAPYLHCVIIE